LIDGSIEYYIIVEILHVQRLIERRALLENRRMNNVITVISNV